MRISNLKTMNDISDRDLLNCLLATQLQILRKFDFLESKIAGNDVREHSEATKEMIDKIDSSFDRINDYLSMDDLEKGQLKL